MKEDGIFGPKGGKFRVNSMAWGMEITVRN